MDRRRNLITIISRHILDAGYDYGGLSVSWHLLLLANGLFVPHSYVEAAERLQAESGVSLSRVDVADNIDLLYILAVGYVFDVPVSLPLWLCWVQFAQ